MDATTLGAVIACAGVLSGSVVAYIGKRGENATTRFNSVTDQVQEQLDRAEAKLASTQGELVALHTQHHEDLEQITRLRIKVIQLGGEP